MEETMTESNLNQQIRDLSQQMNDFSTEHKAAIERLSIEFKEQFAKQARSSKILRFECAITLLIVWVEIAVDFFN